MKIGELATITRTSVETIRYYEKIGLMPKPMRTSSNYRVYTEEHVARLRFIRNCRALDLNHEEIWTLLKLEEHPSNRCQETAQVLAGHIKHVQDRIKELSFLESKLIHLNQLCHCQTDPHESSCDIVLHTLLTQEVDDGCSAQELNTHAKHELSH